VPVLHENVCGRDDPAVRGRDHRRVVAGAEEGRRGDRETGDDAPDDPELA
jgi:hypothetical protein